MIWQSGGVLMVHNVFICAKREMSMLIGSIGQLLHAVLFFVLVPVLMLFAVGTDYIADSAFGAGIMWVSALLAIQLSMSIVMKQDYEDGTFELTIVHGMYPEVMMLVKILVYWLVISGVMLLVAPVVMLLLQMDMIFIASALMPLVIGVLGFVSLSLLGAVLTLGARQSGLLQPLIIVPLTIPLVIFGGNASQGTFDALYIVGGLAVIYSILAILAGAAALTIAIREG